METDYLCQHLEWDSDFFKCKIARITGNRLSQEEMERVMRWCKSHGIKCLYFLADSDDADTARLAEDHQFRFVDVRVTLEAQLDDISAMKERGWEGVIRLSIPDDIPTLKTIAKVSHFDSRFYYDKNFPNPLCDALYEMWIEKSGKGYADAVLVAELRGRPVGYISCHLLEEAKGQIGLVGVSGDAQGIGLGPRLVHQALEWFAQRGVSRVTVVTQGRNSRGQRTYQKCGFVTRHVQLWYHRWF